MSGDVRERKGGDSLPTGDAAFYPPVLNRPTAAHTSDRAGAPGVSAISMRDSPGVNCSTRSDVAQASPRPPAPMRPVCTGQ